MKGKAIVANVLVLFLASVLSVAFTVALVVAASPSVIPNSGFEEGVLGEVPTHWIAEFVEWEGNDPPAQGTFEHNLSKSGVAYYEGSYSLYGRACFIHTFDRINNPTSETWVHSEYVNAEPATTVTVYMRNISRIRPSSWGWNSYIFLKLSDGVSEVQYHLYEYREWPVGQTLEVNNYNFTVLGADGQMWYGYNREIPSSLDKTHMRVSIGWRAHTWYWYSPARVDISSYVDNILLQVPHAPKAEFTATPETASIGENIKFDASASLPGWNGTHDMPITEYRWDFADGNTTTASTPIVYHSFSSLGIYYVTLTVYAPGATPETNSTTHEVTITAIPVGGYSFPIKGYTAEKPLTLYLALIGILTASFTIAKRRKKQQN